MNNFDLFKSKLSEKNKKLIDSDEFTFYAMDILIFSDSEIDIKELKKYFVTFKHCIKRDKINCFLAYRVLFPINDFFGFLHLPFYFSYDSSNKDIFFRVTKENKNLNCFETLYKKEILKRPILKIN